MTQPKTQMARQDAMYAFLKKHENEGRIYITISDFRKLVGIGGKYADNADLRNFVITTSLKQIKNNYRMDVTCKSKAKMGRTVGFLFIIENHDKLSRIANSAFSICATLK